MHACIPPTLHVGRRGGDAATRSGLMLMLLVGLPGVVGGQEARDQAPPGERLVSVTAGVGNAMGWFGAQGERYFADERLSAFVGLGYAPSLDPNDGTGPTFAAGFRSFTSGVKHRAFLEGSVSQLVLERDPLGERRGYYGPGLQGGYQYVASGGFTLMTSIGVGYALTVPHGVRPWAAQVGASLGYTWRRPRPAAEPLDRRRR